MGGLIVEDGKAKRLVKRAGCLQVFDGKANRKISKAHFVSPCCYYCTLVWSGLNVKACKFAPILAYLKQEFPKSGV